jgi:hypothetical protein
MAIKYITGPSKIYPNWNFWFEKKPSGNPEVVNEENCQLFAECWRYHQLLPG